MIIGIANNLYPPYGRDSGAEIIAQKMATQFTDEGHEVFIISTRPKNEIRQDENNIYYLSSAYENLNKMPTYKKLGWHLKQLIFPPHQKEINHIITTKKPDLFITHNLIGLSFALPRLLSKHKIKHHHVLHDIQLLHPSGLMYFRQEKIINSLLAQIYQHFSKQAFKRADKIISPSKWLLDIHLKKGFFKNQATEIKRNFDIKKIKNKEVSQPAKFFFAGQLEEHKGIKLLISSWQISNFNKDEATLSIAGSGSLEKYLKQAIKEQNNINYLGHLNREAMESTLASHDIAIITSLVYENSPTIIWEAARHGLRIIAPNLGGITELQEFADITLYEPNNSEDLVNKMQAIVLKKVI
jgi:glycosyltransferase involved in cell wall biosynthesis